MNTPNVERIRLWVDRLRDPESKQASNRLRTPNGMCCLGHACQVFLEQTGQGSWDDRGAGRPAHTADQIFDTGRNFSATMLPKTVCDWYGLNGMNPTLEDPAGTGRQCGAVELNDNMALTLPEIADWVEATYLAGKPPLPEIAL